MSTPEKAKRGGRVSLAPLTPDEALAGLLKVKPADVAKLEAETKSRRPKGAGAKKKAGGSSGA